MLSGKLPTPWEGIVPGGGVALFRSAGALEMLKVESEEQIGVDIVKRACEEPLRQISKKRGLCRGGLDHTTWDVTSGAG